MLSEFMNRLGEWPKFTSQLMLIESLNYTHPEIYHGITTSLSKEKGGSVATKSPPKTIFTPPISTPVALLEEVEEDFAWDEEPIPSPMKREMHSL